MLDILSYRQWAISQQFANTLGLMALRILSEGKSIDHLIKKHSHEEILTRYNAMLSAADGIVVNVEFDRNERLYVASTKFGQRVAMLPVFGALTKRGDLCSYGMRDYVGMIDRANKSDKIAGIVLDVESPGGTVDGTNEFGLAVKSSKKPVVAFGDGMVASAAYWVASQAKHIMANKHNATEFGSIGVLYIHENWQAYIQKEIGSVEIIRAPQSTDKARVNVIEPITEDQRLDIRAELKEIAKEFISTVKKGRAEKLQTGEENIFTGKMYSTDDAHAMGMIDSKGTLQDAINKAGELAISHSTSTSKKSNNKQMKFPKLSALFGQSEKAEEEALSAEEQAKMEAAEKKVAEMDAELNRLKADNEAHVKKIAELEAKVTEQSAQVSSLEQEKKELNEKLAKEPAGARTTVIEEEPKPDNSKYLTSVDAEKKKYATI